MTIKDVAREANVSIATISRFLNKNFSSMSEETRARIEEVVRTLNYQPNKLAQGLKGQSRTIAVVVVNMSYPFCISVIRSISETLRNAGYSLIVGESGGDAQREKALLDSLAANGVDGIILQTNGHNNEQLQKLASTMPVVLVDRYFEIPGAKSVITNNEQASYEMCQGLFAQGYQKVLLVSEQLDGLSTRTNRYDGYIKACQEVGIEPIVCWVKNSDNASLQTVIDRLNHLDSQLKVAIYAANGLLMLDLYPLLNALNRPIPQKLGIATFDEPDWIRITQPRMSCVRQPTSDIGITAANTVLNRLRGDIKPHLQPEVQIINSEVLWAQSTQLKKPAMPV